MGVEVQLHTFITLALDRSEQSATSAGRFASWEEACWTGGWVGTRVPQPGMGRDSSIWAHSLVTIL